MITLAIARGRLLKEAAGVLKKTGLPVGEIYNDSRRLIFEFPEVGLKVLIVRPSDVPSYVEYGAADCGIVGKDTLIEEKHDLYEPLDLGVGKCKLVVAAPKGFKFPTSRLLRVATKYPRTSYEHFVKKGVTTDIVKLYGSVELAPIVGLSDVIVDLSATGETLRKNNLVEIETIANITAKVVVNKVSMKVKSGEVKEFLSMLKSCRTVRA
ncbi:MAG: ATP phosphoribosyltransferase [Deltaproteobacteria bacterium]|nr:ATP phosphoribosyltransferase [Deltaproteobacteria bacterium]